MRAADGAVEVVRIDPTTSVRACRSSATSSRAGLCGSGLVDAVSELVRAGLLDPSGRFVTDEARREIAPAASPTG